MKDHKWTEIYPFNGEQRRKTYKCENCGLEKDVVSEANSITYWVLVSDKQKVSYSGGFKNCNEFLMEQILK